MDELLKVREVCELLRVSRPTLIKMVDEGRIGCRVMREGKYVTRRFHRAEVEEFMAGQRGAFAAAADDPEGVSDAAEE